MGRLFGTDGVRGEANADLTPELALSLAMSAAHVVIERRGESGGSAGAHTRPMVVVGRDTRPSGEMLEAAVAAGLTAAGADVTLLGVVPTAAVAHACATWDAELGVMISASHNPMADNGIKLFARGGTKLPDDVEDAVEASLRAFDWPRPTGAGVGRVYPRLDALVSAYADSLLASLPHRLDGLRVVVDCADGAAYALAPEVLRRAGAEVVELHASDNGYVINHNSGATHPEVVAREVVAHGAHAGIALDGDADRCIAADADGAVVDGDQILAVCALGLRERGALRGDAIAATVMANLGLKLAMAEHGVRVVETAVGDRYVLAAMREHGLALGGEQSGHMIFADYTTTGDGILTALQLLGRMAETGRPLADLAGVMRRLPQVLLNVRVGDKSKLVSSTDVERAVAEVEAELGETGRVLVRPSGTEPVVRVMVEAPEERAARAAAERLAAVVEQALASG